MKTMIKAGAAAAAFSCALLSSTNASFTLDPLWSVAPNDTRTGMDYVAWSDTGTPATDNLYNHRQRGMAYNPVTNHLYLTSRVNNVNEIIVIDPASGQRIGNLNVDGISGGNFALNKIGVGADGQVFIGNLTVDAANATNPLKLYRVNTTVNGTTAPTELFGGNPFGATSYPGVHNWERRFGDTLTVRGSGASTQILLGGRTDSAAVLFTTADGVNFAPNPLVITNNADAIAGEGRFYNGISFGAGETFWGDTGQSNARPLGHFALDVENGRFSFLASHDGSVFPARVGPIAYIPEHNLMAGVRVNGATPEGQSPLPQDVFLYDVGNWARLAGGDGAESIPFPGQNNNGNGAGEVVWDSENNILYFLSTNNGIMAFEVIPEPSTYALVFGLGILGFLGVRRRFRRS